MFDINTIISQALAAAVAQATAPLLERIAALENQALVMPDAVDKRITALEKRVFEDLGALIEQEFIASMAVTDVVGHDTVKALTDRVAALEKHTAMLDEHGGLLEHLDNQEWFWGKIRAFTDTAVEQAIENHTECWDHNDFVTEDKLDDYVQKDSFRDEIEDVLNNATIRIRF